MKYLKILLLLLFCGASCQEEEHTGDDENNKGSGINEISYESSSAVFSNPERGFMHTWPVYSEGNPVDVNSLNNLKSENVSLILRIYYFEEFKDKPLSENQLNLIKTDFERFREAGIKTILRFAYTDSMDKPDAPFETIATHLDQLKPIFHNNSDVIAFVQAGLIGAWGEWHASSNGLTSLANKKLVLDKLLEVFPEDVKIQLRTPKFKQEIFDYSTAMVADVGYSTSDIARVGFHNDCFMASSNDYGTYQNVNEEKAYISKEALFVPTGGETCPPTDVPLASCNTAETEMSLLKWTYLNLDYFGPVLQGWRDNDCFTDFQRKLGYRLSLQSSSFINEIETDGTLELDMIINNLGFAPIYNRKNTFLIFRSTANETVIKKRLNFDIRTVVPQQSFELKESVAVSDIPEGTYELLLKFEDFSEKLSERPEYSIRLANNQLWEAETGYNKLLHQIRVK